MGLRALKFAGTARAPFDVTHFISNGQSLGSGLGQSPISTTQPFSNLKMFDSSGVYDINDPNAGTLSLVPLVTPERPIPMAAGQYPINVVGETCDCSAANEVTRLALAQGFHFRMASTCVAVSGAAMTDINKPQIAYEAGLYEARVMRRLLALEGLAFGVGGILFTHGEADAAALTPRATYQAELIQLQADYQHDLSAITGQTRAIPILASLQHSEPNNLTAPFGPDGNSTARAILNAADATPLVIATGPKYQYVYQGDNVHMADYRTLGEKYAEVFSFAGTWVPLRPVGFVRVDNVVTIAFHVPTLPLVFDLASIGPGPHTAGPWQPFWAAGHGFEAYEMLPTPIGASSTNPIVIPFSAPHGLTTGDPIALSNIDAAELQGAGTNQAANGVFTCTVVDPTHASLDGSVHSGVYAVGGSACVPLTIDSVFVSERTVVLTLSRAPTPGRQLVIGYADQSPLGYGIPGAGARGRYGCLRDSDPFVGPTGFPNPNWAVSGAWNVA